MVQSKSIFKFLCRSKNTPYIFETFHRGANVGRISGTGLGLAITKQNVEQYGGAITFESEIGVGSSFTVTIPLTPIPPSTENSAPMES